MSDDPLVVKVENYIAWLTLNRPEKRNTMTADFFVKLREIFPQLDADPAIRVVVIKAEGKSFTGGLDVVAAAGAFDSSGADGRDRFKREIMLLQDSINVIEACRKPVIAAVHSHCIGGGVDMLCACDIRMATADAIFSIRETKMAMVADLGTLQRLPTIVGWGRARELALTGRNFTAAEALAMGFITHVAADRPALYLEAGRLAAEIAACSPVTVQNVKEVMNYSRDHGINAGLEYVAQKNAAILPSEDVMEAFQSFIQKRPANFTGK